ncbi:MAG: hypothetical protein A07HR60_02001 [uncultured archaeon A07HR60]|jgi:hypothetical protein|nr:MAG: hypothetical protein A07HR60_02001 [uncultured archaeon A07HR60]
MRIEIDDGISAATQTGIATTIGDTKRNMAISMGAAPDGHHR